MKQYQNHIVVPVDFSEQSLIALSQSYNIARFKNCDLTLVYVLEEDFKDRLKHFFKQEEEMEKQMRDDILKQLKALSDKTELESGLIVHSLIAEGSVHDEIIKVADSLNASFIIMGTNGAGNFSKKFIGSNAWRVINEAQCPVISIKGKSHHSGCRKILLPLDVSRESRDKVTSAIELAQYFGSEIAIISLYESDDEFLVNKLKRQMESTQQFIIDNGVTCSAEMIKSKELGKTVVEYANQIDADLIMIVSQQDLKIAKWLIGSEAQEIINNSDIPVLSIHPMYRKDTVEFPTS